jgi:ketosteroid isomerase-like protein
MGALKSPGSIFLLLVVALSFCGCEALRYSKNKPEPEANSPTFESVPLPPPEPAKPAPVAPQPVITNPAPAVVAKPATVSTPKVEKPDLEAERQTLLDLDVAFSEASQARGAAQAFYEFMAPEGTLLQTGEPPIKGIETIRVRLAAGPQGTLIWKPVEADVSPSAAMGYTWGSYESRSKTPGHKMSYGKYVNVWKKQKDGTWKVVLSATTAGPENGSRRGELGNQ